MNNNNDNNNNNRNNIITSVIMIPELNEFSYKELKDCFVATRKKALSQADILMTKAGV